MQMCAGADGQRLSLLLVRLSPLTFHRAFYMKIKDREEGKH